MTTTSKIHSTSVCCSAQRWPTGAAAVERAAAASAHPRRRQADRRHDRPRGALRARLRRRRRARPARRRVRRRRVPVDQLPAKLEKGWKQPDAFANGRLRIYKNRGTDAEPRFEDFTFLQAGGADATIPIT
jgi:hypothetical protein